jgi:hypothetical protein
VRSEIIVGETTYATYASSKGELVVLQASVLKSARDAIDVNFTGLTGTFAAEFETPTERTLTLAARRVKDRVVASVRARHPGLHISLSAVDRGAFSIAVDSLQKEVLPNDDWWESIDIAFFVSVVPKKAIVHCSVDGKYGEGIGRPPSEYQDMEPKYSKQLQTYEKALLATAQEALLQP